MATRKASNNRISPQASQASGPSSQPYSAASSSDIPPDGLSGRLGSANAPRLSFQEAALGEGARSAGLRSSTSWSFMRNRGSHEQSSDLDNWQTLQDLVGKQDEDLSEGRKLLGHPSHKRSRTFNLTTVFSSTGREEESSSPTVRVLERNAERDAEAEVPLSASPPQLDGLYGVDVHEDEDERGEPPNGINGLNGHTLEDGEDDSRDSPIPFLAENHRSSTQTSLKGSSKSFV